jgi:preprotein translocase subunit SecG
MLVYYLITALHVVVCVILILVVLLQSGKGADLAGAFGGGATQTAFGSRGPASFLSKLTTAAAILFMITCLSLSIMGDKREVKSVLDNTKAKQAPAQKAPTTAKPATAPTPDQIKKIQEEIEARQSKPPLSSPATAAPAEKQQQPAAKPAGSGAPPKSPAKQ